MYLIRHFDINEAERASMIKMAREGGNTVYRL